MVENPCKHKFTEEDIEIAFSIKYLIDGLRRCNQLVNATEYSNKPNRFDTLDRF